MDVYLTARNVPVCCHKRNTPDFIQNPYNNELWDSLPCPPPWNREIIFHSNWIKHLDGEEGTRIIIEIARRCNFSVPQRHRLPGRVASSLILTSCEIECKSIVVVICLVLLVVGVALLAFLFHVSERQRNATLLKKGNVQKKYTENENNQFCGDRRHAHSAKTKGVDDKGSHLGGDDKGTHINGKHVTPYQSTYGYGHLSDNAIEPVARSTLRRGCETCEHFYETLSSKNKLTINSNKSTNSLGEDDYDGHSGHIYETLILKDEVRNMFSSPPVMVESPLAGNVVRKWEYQMTLNRREAMRRKAELNVSDTTTVET